MYLLLLSMSAHLTKELGMAPGGEFRRWELVAVLELLYWMVILELLLRLRKCLGAWCTLVTGLSTSL